MFSSEQKCFSLSETICAFLQTPGGFLEAVAEESLTFFHLHTGSQMFQVGHSALTRVLVGPNLSHFRMTEATVTLGTSSGLGFVQNLLNEQCVAIKTYEFIYHISTYITAPSQIFGYVLALPISYKL